MKFNFEKFKKNYYIFVVVYLNDSSVNHQTIEKQLPLVNILSDFCVSDFKVLERYSKVF